MLPSVYSSAYDEALAMLQQNVKSRDVLIYLASAAEKAAGSDAVVSILFVDKEGLLRNAASPQLPVDYLQAIDGLKPDANVGTCAAAAATGQIVFTPSFYADNKWSELRHLPTSLGFQGAWSFPIKNEEEKVVGTFGTYFRHQRKPSEVEIEGTALLASVAALALSKMYQ
jgi:GAF domain-containing protein